MKQLLELGIQLVVSGLIFWLIWLRQANMIDQSPFNKVAQVVLAVAAVIFLINLINMI